MEPKKKQQWFVAKTRANQERAIQERLTKMGIETYLPSRIEERYRYGKRRKEEVLLIPNTLFIYTDKNMAWALPNHHGFFMKYMIDYLTRTLLVVPEKQMQNFMFLLDVSNGDIQIDNRLLFVKGDKVRITQGTFAGLEGELIRIEGKRKMLVRLDNIIACSVKIAGSHLEKIKNF